MPLEGGLYQWAKLGFNELFGFMVAWNLWLYVITNTSEAGLQSATNLAYAIGPRGAWIASNKWMITLASVLVVGLLVYVSTVGLSVGKWVHNVGGIMLTVFAVLIALPFVSVARGTIGHYAPLATALPVVSLFSLNILRQARVRRARRVRVCGDPGGRMSKPGTNDRALGVDRGAGDRAHVHPRDELGAGVYSAR